MEAPTNLRRRPHVALVATILAVFVVFVRPAWSADYPTDADEMDKFCESIDWGENTSLSESDLLWARKNCNCTEGFRCGYFESKRYQTYARRVQGEKDAAFGEAVARSERARQAYLQCRATGLACEQQRFALDAACKAQGLVGSWETCMAGPVPGIATGGTEVAASSTGKTVSVDLYSVDEKLCPGALVLFPGGEEPHRCIPCSGLSGQTSDMPTSGLTYCAQQEAKGATTSMEREFQGLLRDFPARATDLRKDQSAWVRKRDATCGTVLAEYEGGTVGPMNYASCQATWARQRVEALWAFRTQWSGH